MSHPAALPNGALASEASGGGTPPVTEKAWGQNDSHGLIVVNSG